MVTSEVLVTGNIWGTWPREIKGPSSQPPGVLIYKPSLASNLLVPWTALN